MEDFLSETSISHCISSAPTQIPNEACVAQPIASLVSQQVSKHPLAVVNHLRDSGGDLASLREKPYMIKSRWHSDFQSLVLLHYEQTDSKMSDPIVRECRGIILDEAQNWLPVCLPYLKFDNFNAQLHKFTEAEWAQAVVYPKIDGTLVSLYYAYESWHVATSNVPDASGTVMPWDDGTTFWASKSFKELFWEVWEDLGYPLANTIPKYLCLMFELCTPQNRVIVPIAERRLLLHGARDMRTLSELPPQTLFESLGLQCLQPLPFASIQAVVDAANSLSPTDAEGFVVVFGEWERVKVKSPAYVLTALLPKSELKWEQAVGTDPKVMERLSRIVALGEGEEFSCAFPHLRRPLNHLRFRFDNALRILEQQFEVLHSGLPQDASSKEVAEAMNACSLPKSIQGMYFQYRRGLIVDLRAAFCNRDDKSLLSLINHLSATDTNFRT